MANPLERIQEQRAQRLSGVAPACATTCASVCRSGSPSLRTRSRESTSGAATNCRRTIFWQHVDVSEWTKQGLDAACRLLDLDANGKKLELIARIQDWVHEPELIAKRAEQARLEKERDAVLDGRVFGWGGGGKALFDRDAAHASTPNDTAPPEPGNSPLVAPPQAQDAPSETEPAGPASADDSHSSTTTACFLYPREVSQLTQVGHQQARLTNLACARANGHLGFITDVGCCFMWGRGDYGELGVEAVVASKNNGTAVNPGNLSAKTQGLVHVTSLQHCKIKDMSVGNCHSAAVATKGVLYTWGGCWSGQLGLGESKRAGVKDKRQQLFFPAPTVVEALHSKQITKVSCGAVHTAALSRDGQLFTFGCGDGGRLGLGTNADSPHPELVKALECDVVLDVCCGSWHSLCIVARTDDPPPKKKREDTRRESEDKTMMSGYVKAAGSTLIIAANSAMLLFAIVARIPDLYHRRIQCTAIATSSHHCCALSAEGELFTWGQNAPGCLGRATIDGAMDSLDPDVVPRACNHELGVGPIISIAAGDRFTLFATGPWEPQEEQDKNEFYFQEKLNRHSKFQV
ncbi:hypothetical protein FI667_g6936, partial [Globisporangium splendens]